MTPWIAWAAVVTIGLAVAHWRIYWIDSDIRRRAKARAELLRRLEKL